jgi:omega-amidase
MNLTIHTVFSHETLFNDTFKTILKRGDIIVLPEMFFGGYDVFIQDKKFFVSSDHEILNKLRDISRDMGVLIISGSLPFGTSWKDRQNTSFAFYNGKMIYRYDKIHLFKPLNEEKFFKPGIDHSNFKVKINNHILRCGVIICYDLRFPELTRIKAHDGLDVLFVPAWWPKEREEIWFTLLKARAIENQIFVIGVNSESDIRCGNSYAFTPDGNMIFSTKIEKKKKYYSFEINLSRIQEIKKFINSFKDAKLLNHLYLEE